MTERHETQQSNYDKTEKALRRLLMHKKYEFWDIKDELASLWDSAGETSLNLQYLKTPTVLQSLPPKSKPFDENACLSRPCGEFGNCIH